MVGHFSRPTGISRRILRIRSSARKKMVQSIFAGWLEKFWTRVRGKETVGREAARGFVCDRWEIRLVLAGLVFFSWLEEGWLYLVELPASE